MANFIPKRSEKEVISMRISTDKLAAIDGKAAQYGISRNEFINQCIDFALQNLEDEENK
ncbi:MAG: CopG family transcriptional regulator [Ruminococcaceae bacterium]|nr:CopG family transcriptional regulator [Oscillospiraceae bacterium]